MKKNNHNIDSFMKSHIRPLIATAILSVIIATGCAGDKDNKTAVIADGTQTTAAAADIRGQWDIENIVFSDSDYVRPDEAVPGSRQYITFEDSTYFVMTNCNSMSGSYTVKGDSIIFGDGAMTEMACDNMDTEDALRRILPHISTIEIQNDSVIRLNGTTPAECILLRKIKTEIK